MISLNLTRLNRTPTSVGVRPISNIKSNISRTGGNFITIIFGNRSDFAISIFYNSATSTAVAGYQEGRKFFPVMQRYEIVVKSINWCLTHSSLITRITHFFLLRDQIIYSQCRRLITISPQSKQDQIKRFKNVCKSSASVTSTLSKLEILA